MQRTTDYARILLRRAQLGLAAFAVPVAAAVGVLVTYSAAGDPGAGEPAAAAPASSGGATPAATDPQPDRDSGTPALERAPHVAEGAVAGLATLGICWSVLGSGCLIWRRRLDHRDLRDWEASWARVEPSWSERRH